MANWLINFFSFLLSEKGLFKYCKKSSLNVSSGIVFSKFTLDWQANTFTKTSTALESSIFLNSKVWVNFPYSQDFVTGCTSLIQSFSGILNIFKPILTFNEFKRIFCIIPIATKTVRLAKLKPTENLFLISYPK